MIDDLARFRRAILGVEYSFAERFSGIRGLIFTKHGEDISQYFLHKKCCFVFRISCCIFKLGRLKVRRPNKTFNSSLHQILLCLLLEVRKFGMKMLLCISQRGDSPPSESATALYETSSSAIAERPRCRVC